MVKKAGGKGKSSRNTALAAPDERPAAIASEPDERRIRERAYDIWIEEGRPHGRDLAHWRRARQELHQEL
jgi:hypothetical protein